MYVFPEECRILGYTIVVLFPHFKYLFNKMQQFHHVEEVDHFGVYCGIVSVRFGNYIFIFMLDFSISLLLFPTTKTLN